MRLTPRSVVTVALLAPTLRPVIANAQTDTASIAGIVTADRGEPVMGAVVELVGSSRATSTGADGSFRLTGLGAGTVFLTVRSLGFEPLEVEVDLLRGEHFVIGPGILVMSPIAVPLPGLAVRGERLRWAPVLERSGFYGRMERELGVFADREQLDAWSPQVLSDAFRHMPGVRVRPNPRYGQRPNRLAARDTRRHLVELTRNPIEGCPPLLFVDGVFIGNLEAIDIDVQVNQAALAGVEVYRGSTEVPPRFRLRGSACGVIALWTQ